MKKETPRNTKPQQKQRSNKPKYKKGPQAKLEQNNTKEEGNSVRLNRYIANAGVCSRREADAHIKSGKVSVNKKKVTEMGYQVKPGDKVYFLGKLLKREANVYILLNKPKDTITTNKDEEGRRTVLECVDGATDSRLFPIGRLDRNTTGVLLLTNDGLLSQRLTHPKFHVKKIYSAVLDKPLEYDDLQSIAMGVELEDGPMKVDQIAYTDPDDQKRVGVEIHSGKNRIIHRIFESVGYKVNKLDRVLYANLDKRSVKRGSWRHLSEKEVMKLRKMTGLLAGTNK